MLETRTRRAPIDYKYVVVSVFILGSFMNQLDTTVVNVALPTLARQLHAGTDKLELVATGYLLSLAVWVPVAGWVGDRFGTKRTFLFSVAIFTAGSVLCGQAKSIEQLVIFRVLQGIGGGMIIPVGTAMLFRAFPPIERPKAAAFLAIPTLIAPMMGPIFGGWLVDNVSWRWIFYINLPVGLIALVVAGLWLEEHKEEHTGVFDVAGFVLSGASLGLVLFALSRAPSAGWVSFEVAGLGLLGLLLFALLIYVELHKDQPMLKLQLFSNRMFRSTNVAWFMASAGLLGTLFLLPLYLQQLRGFSAVDTGLTTLPQGLAMALTLQLTSRIYPYVGPRRMMAFGMLVVAASTGLFLFVGLGTSLVWIGALLFFRGTGMAFAMVANQAASFATIEPRDLGRASSLSNANMRISSAVGVAVIATVLAERVTAHVGKLGQNPHAVLLAYHDGFFVAFVMGIIGFVFALLIHDEDVAHVLKRRGAQVVPVARQEAAVAAPMEA